MVGPGSPWRDRRGRGALGETGAGGEICVPATKTNDTHKVAPTFNLPPLSLGGPYAVSSTSETARVRFGYSMTDVLPGMHEKRTIHDTCPGGDTNIHTETTTNYPTHFDTYIWHWSCGPTNGVQYGETLLVGPLDLPVGEHAVSASLDASYSGCTQCVHSAGVSTNLIVSLLMVTCDPWIGLDRTGAPASPYESDKVTARASLSPPNPAVERVAWNYSGRTCDRESRRDWEMDVWTTSREKSSASYLAEEVTASAGGGSASTNFTVVKVDVQIADVRDEAAEEAEGAYLAYVADTNGVITVVGTNAMAKVRFTCTPDNLPSNEMVTVSNGGHGELYLKEGNVLHLVTSNSFPACEIASKDFRLHGHTASKEERDGTITIEHQSSGAKDQAFYTVVDIAVTNIKFNHNPYSSANDAINIRRSWADTFDIANGEWVRDLQNEPACYTTNKTITIFARFSAMPKTITKAIIHATNNSNNGSLGNVVSNEVVFVNGISQPEFVEFTIEGKTLTYIGKTDSDIWQWAVLSLCGVEIKPMDINHSGPHTIYTILNEPVAPWSNLFGSKINAWTNALDLVCGSRVWAQGQYTWEGAATSITRAINESGAFQYDVEFGAPSYLDGDRIRLTDCINRLNGQIGAGRNVNCVDCADFIMSFANLVGCSLYTSRMGRDFDTNPYTAIGCSPWTPPAWNWAFSFHEVGWSGECGDSDYIFDPCLRVDGDDSPNLPPHTEKLPTNMIFSDGDPSVPCAYREALSAPGPQGYQRCKAQQSMRQRRDIY